MSDMSFSDPSAVLEHLTIRPGDTVVDIGAGMGAYSLLAADKVGVNGEVYAVEVQLSLVDSLKNLAGKDGIENLYVLWDDAELPNGTKIAECAADSVILTNVLFTIEDKNGLLKEIKRILRPGGKVLIVDWSESFNGIGPQAQHIVSEKFTRDLFTENGFVYEKNVPSGSYHYGMIMTNK